MNIRQLVYNSLNSILAGSVDYGYRTQDEPLPQITFVFPNGGRDNDTESFYPKGQVSITAHAKTKDALETIVDNINLLDWTDLNDATIVKFAINNEVSEESAGSYSTTITFDYWRET